MCASFFDALVPYRRRRPCFIVVPRRLSILTRSRCQLSAFNSCSSFARDWVVNAGLIPGVMHGRENKI